MPYVPPHTLLIKWLDRQHELPGGRLSILYDDLLDVIKAFISALPVDESWYLARYPAVADFVTRSSTTTARSHYVNHGYFEGRHPFATGWNGYSEPVAFEHLKPLLRIRHQRGRLYAEVSREDVLALIRRLLAAIPVDPSWYFASKPVPPAALGAGDARAAASDHFATVGYFLGQLSSDITVDEDWYVNRYAHVREGMSQGLATSAKDHFLKLGYEEACRPTAP
ncbi:MAG: hypothetical protein JSS43_08620 [Proteobacteria bacterium]|nr:hypothetical protein [Pseudomonadota bacterium]